VTADNAILSIVMLSLTDMHHHNFMHAYIDYIYV